MRVMNEGPTTGSRSACWLSTTTTCSARGWLRCWAPSPTSRSWRRRRAAGWACGWRRAAARRGADGSADARSRGSPRLPGRSWHATRNAGARAHRRVRRRPTSTAALQAGAVGFVAKDTPIDRVAVAAVRAAAQGVAWLSPERPRSCSAACVTPEPRARTRLDLELASSSCRQPRARRPAPIARGMENAEIAGEPEISPRTAKNHVSSILAKLGLSGPDPGGDLCRPPRTGLSADAGRRADSPVSTRSPA